MSETSGESRIRTDGGHRWYDLFSRGARDWLRHNTKLREEVRKQLPDMISRPDVLSRPSDRTMRVPVRFLEHYRFRLSSEENPQGAGQGRAKPGDILRRGTEDQGTGGGEGGSGGGELRFVFEFNMEDIVDWIWKELKLPDLEPRSAGNLLDEEITREGWDKRGPRSRLDRRRTLKEAVKRRIAQRDEGEAFSDEDLRYRQLSRRLRPATQAVVIFILDVSASMDEGRRVLAKSFFFWVVHGLRRQYGNVDTVFIAHTNEAWEFTEEEFFSVSATGGTIASTAFKLAHEILTSRFSPERYNSYTFYASDGDNFGDDHQEVHDRLNQLARLVNFMGFLETPQNFLENGRSEIGRLFRSLAARDYPVGSYTVHGHDDIWEAIRLFFQHEKNQAA